MDTAAAECEIQADGWREETERERRDECGRHENMWRSKRAKQNLWNYSSVFFCCCCCIALTTRMKSECHKTLNMVIISGVHTHSHTSERTVKTSTFNWCNNRHISSPSSFSNLPHKYAAWSYSLPQLFFDCCFVVYFCGRSASNKALNKILPHFSSWRCVKVYGSVGACKTFPPCVKELSLKQVGVNSCEPFMSLPDIPPHTHTHTHTPSLPQM